MKNPLDRGSLSSIIYTTVLDTLVPHLDPRNHPLSSGTIYLQLHFSLGNALDLREWLCSRIPSPRDRCGQRLADAGTQSPSATPPTHTHTLLSVCDNSK